MLLLGLNPLFKGYYNLYFAQLRAFKLLLRAFNGNYIYIYIVQFFLLKTVLILTTVIVKINSSGY